MSKINLLQKAFENVRNLIKENGEYTEIHLTEQNEPIVFELVSKSDSIPVIYAYSSYKNEFKLSIIKVNNLFLKSEVHNGVISKLSDSDNRLNFFRTLGKVHGFNTLIERTPNNYLLKKE